jgi:hypothetical protein
MRARTAPTLTALLAVGALLALAACAPEPQDAASTPAPATTEASATPAATASPTPSPTATTAPVAFPSDCRAMLSDAVLAQLGETPLNPPNSGDVGAQADGSLICLWRDPGADTTYLQTTVSRMNRGPALDMLNTLVTDEAFSCYTPDGGTRCEKTWENPTYPVTDGRTLFWRDGVLIDTRYSNLAPSGYTDSVIASIFGS